MDAVGVVVVEVVVEAVAEARNKRTNPPMRRHLAMSRLAGRGNATLNLMAVHTSE